MTLYYAGLNKVPVAGRNPLHRGLLEFIEQPLFTLAVGIVGGIVGLLIYSPVLAVCGLCVILAFHRAKVVTGHSLWRVRVPSYFLLTLVVALALYGLHSLINKKVTEANMSLSQLIASAVVKMTGPKEPEMPKLILSIDIVGSAWVKHGNYRGTMALVIANLINDGAPSVAGGWRLVATLVNGQSEEAIPLYLDPTEIVLGNSPEAGGPPWRLSAADMFYFKVADHPIERGNKIAVFWCLNYQSCRLTR